MAIQSQQRRWHPQRISKLGVRGTSVAICPSFWENPQKSSLKSLKTVSESQPLGRAGKDKPICPEFPIEMSQDDLSCVSECILEACILR